MSVFTLSNCATDSHAGRSAATFSNTETEYVIEWGGAFKALSDRITDTRQAPSPVDELPVSEISHAELTGQKHDALYRLGHSSMLIRLDGRYILTDPVFSMRASPVQFMGPKRFHPVPVRLEDLPPIAAVVISHDHYDHLDKNTVLALDERVGYYVTPLGVGDHLRRWGVDPAKIIELDWWQNVSVGGIGLTATPAQHFSGRGLTDRDRTLWASWVIESRRARLFFSGDSGYFDGFREIGERYGPFDVTMIETGAYNEGWKEIHMMPEQSLQAHLDLRGKVMLPIHNSTFDLALHEWYEPLERIHELAAARGVSLATPVMGQAVSLDEPVVASTWWRQAVSLDDALLATY